MFGDDLVFLNYGTCLVHGLPCFFRNITAGPLGHNRTPRLPDRDHLTSEESPGYSEEP